MRVVRNLLEFLWGVFVLAVMGWLGWKLFTTFSFGEIIKLAALLGLATFIVWYIVVRISATRLDRARAEYRELQKQYGSSAPAYCPHRYISLSQTGVPGVVSMTHKWCRICGKHVGTAKLKESIFGNRWE